MQSEAIPARRNCQSPELKSLILLQMKELKSQSMTNNNNPFKDFLQHRRELRKVVTLRSFRVPEDGLPLPASKGGECCRLKTCRILAHQCSILRVEGEVRGVSVTTTTGGPVAWVFESCKSLTRDLCPWNQMASWVHCGVAGSIIGQIVLSGSRTERPSTTRE